MPKLSLNHIKNARGFTLIELAIVMIISGFMMVAALQAYDLYEKDAKTRVTNEGLARVDKAINDYFVTNGRFPCPSDPGKTSGDWLGKEWGRVRELGTGVSHGFTATQNFVWKNGTGGPVSDAYCVRGDQASDPDDLAFTKCVEEGQASICQFGALPVLLSNSSVPKNGWPTPSFTQVDGHQKCGVSTAGVDYPTDSACTATGEKSDDMADYDGDGLFGDPVDIDGDGNNDSPDTNVNPEEISCLIGACGGPGLAAAHDKAAGGDGDDTTTSGDELLTGMAARDILVLIGGVPFYDLGISARDALDGYGNPIRYAVTRGLTRKLGWDGTKTGIVIATQQPGSSSATMGQENAQYALVSFGKNANDTNFYGSMVMTPMPKQPIKTSTPRVIIPCKDATATGGVYANNSAGGDGFIENENCDADADFISSLGKTMNWNGSGIPDKSYNDDTVVSNISSAVNNLWIAKGNNIYSTNSGNIGVNQDDPKFKLDVNGVTSVDGDLVLGAGSVMCQNSTTDADGDGSNECHGTVFAPRDLEAGTTCAPDEVITAIKDGGKEYTCTKLTTGVATIKCESTNYALLSYTVATQKIVCLNRATAQCKTCNADGTNCGALGACP